MREGNGSVMLTPPRGTRRRWRRCGISRSAATDKCSLLRCWRRRISGRSGVCSYCWRRSWSRCTAHDYWSSLKTMDDDNIGSLRRMVQDLKEMDAAWRESVDGPTPAEQSLYGLILGHVFSEIFLFHHEKYSRLHDTCEDEVEWLVKELKDSGSDFGATLTDGNLNIDGKEEDENLRDNLLKTNAKLSSGWNYVIFLTDNLIELRRSLCEVAPGKADANNVVETREKPLREILPGLAPRRGSYSPPVGKEVECYREIRKRVTSNICFIKAKAELLGRWRCLETREKSLRNILHGLAARRSERSYAPPVGKELECYREIRKWVTSNIFFFKAKYFFADGSRGVCGGNNFASERNQLWSNWEYTLTKFPTSDFQSSGPKGFIFALIFEQLSDFQSLLSIWKRRFSDITIARYSQEESMDVSLGTDSLHIKVDELKTVDVRQDLEVEKKLRHDLYVIDACKSVISNNRPAKKTRYEYLMDIFSAFESMGYSSRSLDIVEFRMYTRILEHLQSYKWLAYAEAKSVEIDLFYELQSDEEEETVISESDTWTREKKSREQYLQEIVSTVDAIESEYFLLRPSLKELLLYDKIERRAIMDIRQSSCCYLKQGQVEGKTGSAEEVALARRVLKSIFRREVELASGLEKEIVDTLGLIFARCMPTETKLTKWLVEHMEDAESDMKALATKDSRGFKLFDSALSSMLEIRELYGKLIRKFDFANWFVYCSLDSYKLFQVPLMEGLTSLPWLVEASP